MKKILLNLSTLLFISILFLNGCSGGGSGGTNDAIDIPTSGEFTETDFYGRWAYLDNMEVINIDLHTYFKEYELIDENLIKVGSRYLIRAGISDVKLKGELATISDSSSQAISRVSSSIGNMNIILKNIKQNTEVTVKIEITDDSSLIGKIINGTLYVEDPSLTAGRIVIPKDSDLTTSTGETEITLIDSNNNSAKFNVNVVGQETDMGILTVTDKPYNFKSSIDHKNDWKYFGYNDGEGEISYTKTLQICNIGTQSISGVSFEFDLDSDANDIKRGFNTDYDGSAVPFSSGECKSYNASFSFKRPIEDKDIKINITIHDNFNTLTWKDYATLKLSQYPHNNLYFNSNTKELNGYLVAPGREIINVEFSSSNSNNFVRVPLVQTDEYDLLISASNINDEDTYMISSGIEADTTKMDGFTNVTANEPDNDESSATKIALFEGESVAYIQQGDVDFYTIVDIPNISSLTPKNAYVDFNISIPMTTDLNISTITIDTLKVATTVGVVVGSTSYNQAKNTLVFTPLQNLTAGVHTITIDKDLQSASGYKLTKDFNFDITVKDYPITTELITHYNADNHAFNVAVAGDYTYVVEGCKLQVVYIADPLSPTLMGESNTLSCDATDIAISDNHAFIADSKDGLKIIDVSNPKLPILKSTFHTAGSAYGVSVSNNIAYIADGESGLQIVDISNLSLPVLKSSFDTKGTNYPANAVNVTTNSHYAYVANSQDGLKIIDISNLSLPKLVGTFNTTDITNGVEIVGDYAYIADGFAGFKIVDISNPSLPTLKGNFDTTGYAYNLAISGDYAYIADYEAGLQIIDISNLNLPTLKENISTTNYARDVKVSGNFIYVAYYRDGLKIFNK